MYIRYLIPQDDADKKYSKKLGTGGDYRPTWLVRVSDWKTVRGTEAAEGYHALSYCWDQSGEIHKLSDGSFFRTDKGEHTLLKERSKIRRSLRMRYDELLQHICQEFGIRYLWVDLKCSNQLMGRKEWDLTQLPLIYRNALYTIALVPEVKLINPKHLTTRLEIQRSRHVDSMRTLAKSMVLDCALNSSSWGKSSWCLVEVMNSTQLVITGFDLQAWFITRERQKDALYEADLFTQTLLGYHSFNFHSVNMPLHYLHFRTSSTEHDKLFALATSLYDNEIFIDYDYNASPDAIRNELYTQMANSDLSILSFGSNLNENGVPRAKPTMDHYGLPSWTGVEGMHTPFPVFECRVDQGNKHFVDKYMQLHIRCRSFTVHASKYADDYMLSDERCERAYTLDTLDKFAIDSLEDLVFWNNELEKMSVALDLGQRICEDRTTLHATHYTISGQDVFKSPVIPLSLTEDCKKCTILGVLMVIGDRKCNYEPNHSSLKYSVGYPVVMQTRHPFKYKAIGIAVPLLKQKEFPVRSQEALDDIFGSTLCNPIRDFIIY